MLESPPWEDAFCKSLLIFIFDQSQLKNCLWITNQCSLLSDSEASGMIDKRTLEKYEKDAKEAGRDSWYLSWALDTNAEERAKVWLMKTRAS